MERKEMIALLLKISFGMLGIMLFTRLSAIYQLVPIVVLLLVTMVLVVFESMKKQKNDYKKYRKKRTGKS
ncbi:MAG TPA: hypothetical protein DCR46_05475 [Cytophagales bacterium]|nr:hypothetical protein [Cytophagales bacterium]